VLVLYVGLDVFLCVSLQRCIPVQEASVLLVLHGDLWVTTAIDNIEAFQLAYALSAMKPLMLAP
jgi:hypothetical protein